jgi:hypothetical protein
MQKSNWSILMLFVVVVFSLAVTSCKDDEPEKFNMTFTEATLSGKESDAEILVEIKLDKPAPADITVKFKLTGTAYDEVRADAENDYADFTVDGEYDNVVIDQGKSTATIKLVPYSDDVIEDDETIIITVTEVDNANVIFDATKISTVTLSQEDGVIIFLEWPESNSTDGFVDMDMIVRIGETSNNYNGIITGSVFRSVDIEYELSFIPKTFIGTYFGLSYTNTTYGLSYTYYDGTRDNLTFTSTFIDFINGAAEPESSRQKFTGNYTKANLNKWVSPTYPTLIAQTFRNVGGTYQDFSTPIVTPVSSSRSMIATPNEFINSLYSKKRNTLRHYSIPEKYLRQF